jgi:hypothetical protein
LQYIYFYKHERNRLPRPRSSIATGAAASFITAHATGAAPSRVLAAQAAVHSYAVAFWAGAAILTVAALTVAPLLRPGLAELGVNAALDPKASCQLPGSSVDRSVAEIGTDGAPACAELKGAS